MMHFTLNKNRMMKGKGMSMMGNPENVGKMQNMMSEMLVQMQANNTTCMGGMNNQSK